MQDILTVDWNQLINYYWIKSSTLLTIYKLHYHAVIICKMCIVKSAI